MKRLQQLANATFLSIYNGQNQAHPFIVQEAVPLEYK